MVEDITPIDLSTGLTTNSDLTVMKRREWVADQYLAGRIPKDIFKEWASIYGMTKHTFDVDVTHAYQMIDTGTEPVEVMIKRHIDLYYDIVLANTESNPSIALKALHQIEKLKKVHERNPSTGPINVQVNNNHFATPVLESMSIEEIKKLLGKG